MFWRVDAAAVWHAHNYRAGETPTRAIAHTGPCGWQSVQGRVDETHELDFGDRLQSLCCHAYGHTGNHAFGQRCVLHTILAELFLQSRGRRGKRRR